jgi:quercetin dioxygenase-like cupin family protein
VRCRSAALTLSSGDDGAAFTGGTVEDDMGTARDRSRFRWREGSRWCAGLALALLAGFATGAVSVTALLAEPPLVKETVLLRTDLAGVDGKELIVSRFETAPGWAHGRHYHVGHELVYVLDGAAIVEVEGKPPVTVPAGATAYFAPRQVHAGRNASPTASFRFLLVRIHEKGQPISVELE